MEARSDAAGTRVPALGPEAAGLSEAEAARRLAERGRRRGPATSRSYASIVRANVLTVFNLILAVFGGLTLAFGDARDALFLGILVANSAIGIAQEVRAKRALDRLAALVAPTATVVRDGRPRAVDVSEVVVGDLVRVRAGDQIVADGPLRAAAELSLDESTLTGESEPVPVTVGDEVRSGSYAVEGTGAYEVRAVGPDSYAERVAGEARAFRHPRSPLERAINRLLLGLVGLMLVLGAALGYALWRHQPSASEAVATATAAALSMVPEGLILLTNLTYAVGALRMARRGALSQQLNAIESLAAVDVICTDKTGTLTEPALRVVELVPAPGCSRAQLARPRPLRRELARPQRHARGDRTRLSRRGRVPPRPVAVLVAAALQRARAGEWRARARGARAVPADARARRAASGAGRQTRARAGARRGAARRRAATRERAAARARRAGRAAATRDARDGVVVPPRGRRAQGALG